MRSRFLVLVASLSVCLSASAALAEPDPLPSWNDGAAKKAIIAFVHETTDPSSKRFVPLESRVATFDQDGTTWVSHPIYTQVVFCLDRVPDVVAKHPELRKPVRDPTGSEYATMPPACCASRVTSLAVDPGSAIGRARARHPRTARRANSGAARRLKLGTRGDLAQALALTAQPADEPRFARGPCAGGRRGTRTGGRARRARCPRTGAG